MSQLSTFVVGPYLFGVEVELVQEIVRLELMTPVPLSAPAIGGLLNLRGEVITAVDLRSRLGMPARSSVEVSKRVGTLNIVVRVDGEPTSLIVDEIGAVITTDRLPFESTPSTVDPAVRHLIGGAYTLPERLLLLLSLERVVSLGSLTMTHTGK